MGQPIRLELDSYLSRKLNQKADREEIPPEELISMYLKYGLLYHKRILEFERKVKRKS